MNIMNRKLITIVTATYNAGKTLEYCIKSVLKQKADDIEYVIVDGASTDNTLDIVEKYKSSIDIIISEKDRGVYDAWNKALDVCHGEWIIFLGADDFYADGSMDKYRHFIETHDVNNVDIIVAKGALVNEDREYLMDIGKPYEWDVFRKNSFLAHGAVLHNRKLFDEVGKYNLKFNISADYELLLRKKLNALYMDEKTLFMMNTGISGSTKCLWQAFDIKRFRKSCSIVYSIYYLIKGFIGFYLKKVLFIIKQKK